MSILMPMGFGGDLSPIKFIHNPPSDYQSLYKTPVGCHDAIYTIGKQDQQQTTSHTDFHTRLNTHTLLQAVLWMLYFSNFIRSRLITTTKSRPECSFRVRTKRNDYSIMTNSMEAICLL